MSGNRFKKTAHLKQYTEKFRARQQLLMNSETTEQVSILILKV